MWRWSSRNVPHTTAAPAFGVLGLVLLFGVDGAVHTAWGQERSVLVEVPWRTGEAVTVVEPDVSSARRSAGPQRSAQPRRLARPRRLGVKSPASSHWAPPTRVAMRQGEGAADADSGGDGELLAPMDLFGVPERLPEPSGGPQPNGGPDPNGGPLAPPARPRADRPETQALPQRVPGEESIPSASDRSRPADDAGQPAPSSVMQQRPETVGDIYPPPAGPRSEAADEMPAEPFAHWPTPAAFRHAVSISPMTCGTCGGCVDRNGIGWVDEAGTYLGVGTRAKRACQCWRCPQKPPFQLYGPGGYVGPARPAPLYEYRLRSGDQVQLTFMIRSVRTSGSYRLVVGDELLIESEADEKLTRGTLDRGLEIQPDGTITLRFIGEVHAAGRTVEQLREVLNERYTEYYPEPAIDVTPVQTGSIARQIREAISGSEGFNAQTTTQTITPEGTIRLPRIGAVPAQGLTLAELKREINLRYGAIAAGLEVEPNLEQQAPHFVYVLGDVLQPGRFEMTAPTTVMGAISMAGGYVPGANLRQVAVFRRGPNWELLSTLLDLRGALLAKDSDPVDEIWVQDGDVIVVPPTPIRLFDRFVQQVFTEGIYGIVPFGGVSFALGNE